MYLGSRRHRAGPADRPDCTYLERGRSRRYHPSRRSTITDTATGRLANRASKSVQVLTACRAGRTRPGYKHFMAKEIAEQPSACSADTAIAHYLTPDGDDQQIHFAAQAIDFSRSIDRVIMVACGTAVLRLLQTAKYWVERLARLPVEVDVASEFRYREPPIPPATRLWRSSSANQGETADTLAALRHVRGAVPRVSCRRVVNVHRKLHRPRRRIVVLADPRRSSRLASPRPRPSPASWYVLLALLASKAARDHAKRIERRATLSPIASRCSAAAARASSATR